MKGAGYLNLGKTASIDPLGYPLLCVWLVSIGCTLRHALTAARM